MSIFFIMTALALSAGLAELPPIRRRLHPPPRRRKRNILNVEPI